MVQEYASGTLAYSDDYGETLSLPHGDYGCGSVHFHPPTGDIWVGSWPRISVSHDQGETFEYYDNVMHPASWVIMKDVDSLVIAIPLSKWSFDTLRTYYYGEREGLSGRAVDFIAGWQNGQHIFLLHSGDTSFTYISNDFSDNYELFTQSTHIPEEYLERGHLFPGYSPGEMYYISIYQRQLFVSTDWGENWIAAAQFLEHSIDGSWRLSFYPAWNPGELFAHWGNAVHEFPYSVEIRYSDDFGETWEVKNGSNAVESLDDDLSIDISVKIWPNPTNGSINVEYPADHFPVIVTDILGRKVLSFHTTNDPIMSLNLSDLGAGTYFLHASGFKTKKILLVR